MANILFFMEGPLVDHLISCMDHQVVHGPQVGKHCARGSQLRRRNALARRWEKVKASQVYIVDDFLCNQPELSLLSSSLT